MYRKLFYSKNSNSHIPFYPFSCHFYFIFPILFLNRKKWNSLFLEIEHTASVCYRKQTHLPTRNPVISSDKNKNGTTYGLNRISWNGKWHFGRIVVCAHFKNRSRMDCHWHQHDLKHTELPFWINISIPNTPGKVDWGFFNTCRYIYKHNV